MVFHHLALVELHRIDFRKCSITTATKDLKEIRIEKVANELFGAIARSSLSPTNDVRTKMILPKNDFATLQHSR
jgi:hypothetical protein